MQSVSRHTSPKCDAFWERILCNNWPQVDVHVIVPTMLKTVVCKLRKQDLRSCKSQDEVDSLQFHLMCCVCEADLADRKAFVGVRCLLYKMETKMSPVPAALPAFGGEGEESCFIYRTSYMSTHFCEKCGEDFCFKVCLDSDHLMINTLLDHFERASFDLILDLNVVDMAPYHFLRCVMLRMGATHLTLLEDLGKLENKCSFCRRQNAKQICGACHLYHYCNDKCSKQDWAQHKPECAFLQKHSICALQEKFHLIVRK